MHIVLNEISLIMKKRNRRKKTHTTNNSNRHTEKPNTHYTSTGIECERQWLSLDMYTNKYLTKKRDDGQQQQQQKQPKKERISSFLLYVREKRVIISLITVSISRASSIQLNSCELHFNSCLILSHSSCVCWVLV